MVIGTSEGIAAMQAWSDAMNCAHAATETKTTSLMKLHRLWPPYPGFEVAFGSPWSTNAISTVEINREGLLNASRKKDSHERCYAVVEQIIPAFEL